MKYLKKLFLISSLIIIFSNPLHAAKFKWEKIIGTEDGATDFYLDRKTIYKGHNMTPGTAAYMLTPAGARKLLRAAEKHGLEQSDFIINERNLKMEYISPSIVKFNTRNLNLSHQYESSSNSNTG